MNTYDIEAMAEQVLAHLTTQYPINVRPNLKWASKVRAPIIRWKDMERGWYGYVDGSHRNLVITLNYSYVYDKEELVDTIAHEYCHLMQDAKEYKWYSTRQRTKYWAHPLEIEAREFATLITEELKHLIED